MQQEFERLAHEMFTYLKGNGVRAKRPFPTIVTMPTGYILSKEGNAWAGARRCEMFLPDARLYFRSTTTQGVLKRKGRLFARDGFKVGQIAARDEFGGYIFEVDANRVRVARAHYDESYPCDMAEAFADYAQRIISFHR